MGVKSKEICHSPPQNIPGGTWNCPLTKFWNKGDICHISGQGCTGNVRCKKGVWQGKPNCPKNCIGNPQNPIFGGTWKCENDHYSSCNFNSLPEFTCTNGVTCNTKTGVWRGRVQCRFSGQKPLPPARPSGNYECRSNGRCKFVCDDGRESGRMFYDRKNGKYTPETKWNFCCPEPFCENGVASDYSENQGNCPTCISCDSGYELE